MTAVVNSSTQFADLGLNPMTNTPVPTSGSLKKSGICVVRTGLPSGREKKPTCCTLFPSSSGSGVVHQGGFPLGLFDPTFSAHDVPGAVEHGAKVAHVQHRVLAYAIGPTRCLTGLLDGSFLQHERVPTGSFEPERP